MVFRFKPRLEWLEHREVPATWTWDPLGTSVAGDDPTNWREDGVRSVTSLPDDATDNVFFGVKDTPCKFGNTQGTLGKISVDSGYASTITLGGASTVFAGGASILSACTIDLDGTQCNFGGTGTTPSVIGATGARATIKGGGSIEVTLNGRIDLANVNLASSVNVSNGGMLTFGFVNYGTDTESGFTVRGTVQSGPNAQFISSTTLR